MNTNTSNSMKMRVVTPELLSSFGCNEIITKSIPPNWKGTIIDILNMDSVRYCTRISSVIHPELMSPRLMRLFAVMCGKRVRHLLVEGRSIEAIISAENYAKGRLSDEELQAALILARGACWSLSLTSEPDSVKEAAKCARFTCEVNPVVAAIGASKASLIAFASANKKNKAKDPFSIGDPHIRFLETWQKNDLIKLIQQETAQ